MVSGDNAVIQMVRGEKDSGHGNYGFRQGLVCDFYGLTRPS